MKYDTLLFLRTPGQELLHSITRFLYLEEAVFTKEQPNCLIYRKITHYRAPGEFTISGLRLMAEYYSFYLHLCV